MGRYSTGITTVNRAAQLNLSALMKAGAIKKGQEIEGEITLGNGGTLSFRSYYVTYPGAYVELTYSVTREGEPPQPYSYRIPLQEVPSNLGSGSVVYFVCNWGGERARILYMAYGSHHFKCRTAYRNRLYYRSQLSSKLDKYNDCYFRIEDQLEDLLSKRRTSNYRGKPTRLSKRIARLLQLQSTYDVLRFSACSIPASLRPYFRAKGII